MTGHREWIDDYKPYKVKRPIRFGNNEYLYAIGEGSVPVVSFVGNEDIKVRIKNVSYFPNIGLNLVSLSVADDNAISFESKRGKIYLYDGDLIATGSKVSGLYELSFQVPQRAYYAKSGRTLEDWHETLGHADIREFEKMAEDKCVDGMAIVAHGKEDLNCGNCQKGKG